MTDALDRLLRLRILLEDAARADLEKQVMLAARVDRARQREEEGALRLRNEGLVWMLAGGGPAGSTGRMETVDEAERRFLAERERESVLPRRERLRRMAEREGGRMLACQEEFLARRKARQQVEILLRAEARGHRVDEMRREQRDLDDWFVACRARRFGRWL